MIRPARGTFRLAAPLSKTEPPPVAGMPHHPLALRTKRRKRKKEERTKKEEEERKRKREEEERRRKEKGKAPPEVLPREVPALCQRL